MSILLAVGLTAFSKIVADCHTSLIHISNLVGNRRVPFRLGFIGVGKLRAPRFLSSGRDFQP
jgi:hypothetical protein